MTYFERAYEKLKNIIADVCKNHDYLKKSDCVNRDDLAAFARLMAQDGTDTDVQNSLLILSRMMHAHYGKPVILLIDEYDVPLAKANEEKEDGERYYGQMLEVMTVAVAQALMDPGDLAENAAWRMREFGRKYPGAGYGARFASWLRDDAMGPYGSYGNGAAIAGSIAGAYYQIPSALILQAEYFLPQEMIDIVRAFDQICEGGHKMENREMEAHEFAELIYGKKIRSKSTGIEGYGKPSQSKQNNFKGK